jgi:hypothetical protein
MEDFTKELIRIFAENTGCDIQHNGCPCNTCFHNQGGDFRHITWLIVLALRGDYNQYEILNDIQEELECQRRTE